MRCCSTAFAVDITVLLRKRWAVLTARVSRSMISCMNARLTRALLAPAVGQTMWIGDNYLNDGHAANDRRWDKYRQSALLDGQSATEFHHAIHHTQITRASIPWHNGRVWHLAIAVSFLTPPAVDQPHHRPPRWSAAWVVVHSSWRESDFDVCIVRWPVGDRVPPCHPPHANNTYVADFQCVHQQNSKLQPLPEATSSCPFRELTSLWFGSPQVGVYAGCPGTL